jgi:ketosteroid isomerase-like protein
MQNLILICASLAVAANCAYAKLFQQPVSRGPDDSAELSRLEDVWNEAHVRNDADALARLWSDDLIVQVTNMRVMSKTDSIGMLRSGRMKFKRYQSSNLRIRVYGDAAVVTGQLERTRELDGRNVDDKWRFTKVYVRTAGRWQVVAFHTSTLDQ